MNTLDARRRLLGRNIYKKTTEGNPAIAQGSLARRYPGIEMQGWTEQNSYEGNQLFDILDFDDNNKGTIQNGTILFNQSLGTVTYSLNLKAGKYSISFKRSGYSGISVKVNDVQVIINGNYSDYANSFDVNDGDSVILEFSEGQNPDADDREVYDIMLNSGSTALPYEPYTGGAPSPSPDYPQEIVSAGNWNEETQKYEYGIEISGKNLLDIQNKANADSRYYSTNENGEIIQIMGDGRAISAVPATQMLLPGEYSAFILSEGNFQMLVGDVQYDVYANNVVTFSVSENTEVRWKSYQSNIEYPTEPMRPMLVRGSQVYSGQVFEQYKTPQSVTLTSDRPLTKWDRLEKRGGQWGWVYKSEEIESYTDGGVPGEYFSTTGQLSVGAQVWYETTEETFVPLSETEQEQMNALHTFRPTTVLTNDVDCNMSLTYKTKKSMGGGVISWITGD